MFALKFMVYVIIVLGVFSDGTFMDGEKSQCEVIEAKVAMENQNMVVDSTVKRLIGTWLSEGCEIRPGPEYVLRSYTFRADGTYRVIQHRYWDDSCSSPKYTVISNGLIRMKRDSLLNPDAATGFVRPINISVIPQDIKAVQELDALVASECPEQNWKSWRRYEEHLVFESNEYLNDNPSYYNARSNPQSFTVNNNANSLNTQRQVPQTSGDLNCMGSLKWAFNELKLIKIQLRPILDETLENLDTHNVRFELLLGDIHSRYEQRQQYMPTAFQLPLLKYVRSDENIVKVNGKSYTVRNTCNICANLYSSDKSPPHLIENPHLPPYVWGEWTSLRCEIRPMGLYLTRKFSFYSEDSVWIGEHKFYQDPFCTVPKFVVTAAGQFLLTSTSGIIEGSTNVDFKIERASLTLFSRRMVHEMRIFKACGSQHWEVGIPQELSSTNGCLQLGIVIPSIQYELIKVEMNYEGSCLLYLGQADTDNMPRSSSDRPTAFQVPLIKCGDAAKYSEGLREILSNDPYYDDISYSDSSRYFLNNVLFILTALYLFA